MRTRAALENIFTANNEPREACSKPAAGKVVRAVELSERLMANAKVLLAVRMTGSELCSTQRNRRKENDADSRVGYAECTMQLDGRGSRRVNFPISRGRRLRRLQALLCCKVLVSEKLNTGARWSIAYGAPPPAGGGAPPIMLFSC